MIETSRLLLRNWREEDVAPFIEHTNRPAVMRWLGGARPAEEMEKLVRNRMMRWQDERGFTFWLMERKADGELLGFCGLKLGDDPGSPVEGEFEIGWRLREDAWGQGYAGEAAAASLDFAFDRLDAKRVVALTVVENEPSWRLMERLGMIRRPELDYSGPYWANGPVIVYEARRDLWRS